MANGSGGDWHNEFMWGAVVLFFVGIYSWVGKHMWGHVTVRDITSDRKSIDRLKDDVQYKDNCDEIVKRIEATAKSTHDMLERVLNKLDNM